MRVSVVSDRVIVVLDRAEALILAGQQVTVKDIGPGLWTNVMDAEISAQEKLRAALDRDREELIERLARHMHPEAWPELYPGKDWRRDKARENAQAVLALLENGGSDE